MVKFSMKLIGKWLVHAHQRVPVGIFPREWHYNVGWDRWDDLVIVKWVITKIFLYHFVWRTTTRWDEKEKETKKNIKSSEWSFHFIESYSNMMLFLYSILKLYEWKILLILELLLQRLWSHDRRFIHQGLLIILCASLKRVTEHND